MTFWEELAENISDKVEILWGVDFGDYDAV